MGRSRKFILTDWTSANNALIQYFEGNKSKLSNHVQMSRTTITKFFNERPISESNFRTICFALRLSWQKVSSIQNSLDTSTNQPSVLVQSNEANQIPLEKIRKRSRQIILDRHSRMRLLSGEEIGVDQLYVDVYVLNRLPRTFQVSPGKMRETFNLREDRLGFGDRIKRDSGFEIANNISKLVILGKPGSGKTTFLKHLAVDWCTGKFQSELLAVVIELRRTSSKDWNCLKIIDDFLGLNNWHERLRLKREISNLEASQQAGEKDPDFLKKQEEWNKNLQSLPLERMLTQGKLLILVDGLDEVPTNELRVNVQQQIYNLSEKYPENRFILTCRTQVMQAIPINFTSVEIAEFSQSQVSQFVKNWFKASGETAKSLNRRWKNFNLSLKNKPDLKELTVTPVLLSLMCLVFQDEGQPIDDRAWLYKKGIKLLLSRWNEEKQIDDWQVGSESYRKLSLEDKEDLLIGIAARKFENPRNFVLFEEEELSTQVNDFLKLRNHREGVSVLRAIESQHGLLIERADGLWSFSHLTFQEYFTVQWLSQLSPTQLTQKVTDRRWQEVVKKLVQSQQPADRLIRLIRQGIEKSISKEIEIQQFLNWLSLKSLSTQSNYKISAIRAFYYELYYSSDLTFNLAGMLDGEFGHTVDCYLERIRNFSFSLDSTGDLDLHDCGLALDLTLTLVLKLVLDFDGSLAFYQNLLFQIDLALAFSRRIKSNLTIELEEIHTSFLSHQLDCEKWWYSHRIQLIQRIRKIMIKNRNIGFDWKFTNQQKQRLELYCGNNEFIIHLINIKGAVSDEVFREFENTLLLPWTELQNSQSMMYEQL